MPPPFRWDDFVLDLDAYRLHRGGVPLSLEPKAFNLLVLMVQRPGHLFSKQEIFDAVWPDTAVTDHALTRVVAQLRRVLGDEAREARYIETVPTRGYRWIRPIEEGPAAMPAATAAAKTPIPPPQRRRALVPGLAAALALSMVVLALLLWTQRGTETWAPSVSVAKRDVQWPVQVTTHGGLDLQPSLSPQGDGLAYVSDRTGAFEVYVRAFGGTATETPLTSDGEQNVQPVWSPDGRSIAYHSYRRGGIWVIPARGGIPRQIAPEGSNPAWSPDGQRIAFQSDEHADVTPTAWGAQSGSTIWTVGADGRNLQQMTRSGHPIGGHAAPAWSSNARSLAFTVFEGGAGNGIWLLNLATRETRFLEHGVGLYELVFAPDNSALYAAGGEAMIVRIPLEAASGMTRGAREVIPVAGVPGVRGLTISADGTTLAFAGLALSSHIWSQAVDGEGSARSQPRALTSDTSRRNSLPAISPDGSRVAYMSKRGGELPKIWVMDINGRNGLQLTSDDSADSQPSWFPDGRRVAYYSGRRQTPGVWSVDIATRREEIILDLKKTEHASRAAPRLTGQLAEFELAPSMTRAAFSMIAPPAGRRLLYVSGIEPFAPRALSDATQSIGYPAWSPNERHLAVEIKDGSSTHAGVIDVVSGALRRLTHQRGQTWVRSWSPDSRKLAVAALRDGLWSLQWIDVNDGSQGTITATLPPHVYARYPEWSPRGDFVVFERGELRGNIWMLTVQ